MDIVAANQSDTEKIPQLKVLVVDDDMLNQRMLQVMLTREGHEVVLASNGLEALNLVKLHHYDIVFMDLQMPIMDGVEASRHIRDWENEGHHTFIVALTASYLPKEGNILFEAGIDNYISKPFAMKQIRQLLKYGLKSHIPNVSDQPNPPQKRSAEPILDIQKGIDQVGGDVRTYAELLDDLIRGLPERLQTIGHLFKELDLTRLSRAAHNLQGVASNLGASQLSECCKRLDEQSADRRIQSIEDLLREIQVSCDSLVERANNFLADHRIEIGSP